MDGGFSVGGCAVIYFHHLLTLVESRSPLQLQPSPGKLFPLSPMHASLITSIGNIPVSTSLGPKLQTLAHVCGTVCIKYCGYCTVHMCVLCVCYIGVLHMCVGLCFMYCVYCAVYLCVLCVCYIGELHI